MNEKNYKKKIELQQKIISKQLEYIESLNLQIEKLKTECDLKDEIINSVDFLRKELKQNVAEIKKYKEEYVELIEELRKMKDIVDKEVYKGRWKLIRFLIK